MKSHSTKNILLENVQANAESIFLREYFSPAQEEFQNIFSLAL